MANNIQAIAKISGYLDKKARLRIGSPWKKYWFVLEGRLLLYYRSKDEYETLSPCKGSINLCPPCNIHPSSSTNCIFQIECRANTVTLRAENRSDQDKWMQALLAAIDQSKSSPTRMSHFRYSLDDLPTPTKEKKKLKNEFIRQNSMPHRTSYKTSENMIDRLQTIGAHTYGGSLETIVRLSTKSDMHYANEAPEMPDSPNYNFLYSKISEPDSVSPNQLHNKDRHQNYIIENDQYSVIQEENSIDMLSHVETPKTPPVEVLVENQQYAGCDLIYEKANAVVENDQYISSDINADCVQLRNNLERPKIEHLYERISRDSDIPIKGERNSLNVGNLYEALPDNGCNNSDYIDISDQYSVVQKRNSVKKTNKTEDHNKNSLIIDNDQYISNRNSADSATYSEAQIIMPNYTEYDMIDKTIEQETIYEDPDTVKKSMYQSKTDEYQYVEPLLPPRPDSKKSEEETSSQTSSQDNKQIKKRKKLFRMFYKIEKKAELSTEVKKPKLKKRTQSFLKKMWRRKTKSLDNGEDDVIYESVDYEIVKKQVEHQCDIEMLEELEKILQTRKDMLQQKLKVYENKLNSDRKEITAKWAKKATENKNGVKETCNDQSRPSLPPRQNSQVSLSNKLETLKENENDENVKSIDEILQDLDKETYRSKKVKELIDKFNDIQTIAQAVQMEEEEDVKRRKPKIELIKSPSDTKIMEIIKAKRDSGDELNKLLEQLAKVTYAPIMSPGVTSSLITPIMTDEEWLNLIPIRRRRSSDPDYDVPRPHSSLQILERSRPNSDNPIPVTRFFGPILPQTQTDTIVTLRSSTSMDPDSLEAHNNLLENIESSALQSLNESPMEREHSISYTPRNSNIHHDHAIYAYPKNLFSSNINNNHILDETITKHLDNSEVIKNNNNVESPLYQSTFTLEFKPEEVFADSLEPITEISTVF